MLNKYSDSDSDSDSDTSVAHMRNIFHMTQTLHILVPYCVSNTCLLKIAINIAVGLLVTAH